ncbi:MAG TPA: SGNH/GDSL hydrolase family protein [Anaerolineales bacterium]|nr:SGNH/GDSL hydrolase family protein [Anaerolineales bacterium]
MHEFKQYLISLIILTGLVSGYVFYRYADADAYPFPVGPRFDSDIRSKYRQMLNKQKPQILVLGDSVARTNIDENSLAQVSGKRVSVISEDGAGSALLYLLLKNNIAGAEAKPEHLIVLFRDTVLTSTGFRVQGTFLEIMDEYAGAGDDIVLQTAIRDRMNPLEKLAEAYLPPYKARSELQALLASRLLYLPTRALLGCDLACSNQAMDRAFGSQNFDPDQFNRAINLAENYLYTDENLDFDRQIERSFLPEIIRLCREKDIKLILVRTKTLRFSREAPEPAALAEYMNDLSAYAQRNEVPLIDLAHSDRLPRNLFIDINHLNAEGRKIFTEMLVEAIRPMLNP